MPTVTSCTYNPTNVERLTFISQGLLDIVNKKIIELPTTTTLPPTSIATTFNCTTWENIKHSLVSYVDDEIIPPGYLDNLYTTIGNILNDTSVCNLSYGYSAQLERLQCVVNALRIRLVSVACNSNCPDVVGDLLCFLVTFLNQLINVVNKLSTLTYYACCTDKVSTSFFNCLVCEFVNDITDLDSFVSELSAIVVAFASCDIQNNCSPCYTAKCAPKKTRKIVMQTQTQYIPCPPQNMNILGNNSCGCNDGGYSD